jgi:hypothetical protein
VLVNEAGLMCSAEDYEQMIEKMEAAAPSAAASQPTVSFLQPVVQTRGVGESAPSILPDLPDDPTAIGQELLANPDLKKGYRCLKHALSDPQLRPMVLEALEGFAKAVGSEQ